jgi:hypothetical protein
VNQSSCLFWDKLDQPHEIPSLDARNMVVTGFVGYLPRDNREQNALELQGTALEQLLHAPFHVFWSHVLFDEQLKQFLESYLRYVSRPYDHDFVRYSGKDLRSLVYQRVFRVLLRASNARESKDYFMEPEYHQNWLRSPKSWFDVPWILDICVLYRAVNVKVVRVLVQGVMGANSKLYEELQKCFGIMIKTTNKAFGNKKVNDLAARDRELFLLDALCSTHALLDVFPKASKHLQKVGMLAFLKDCFAQWVPLITVPQRRTQVQRLCVHVCYVLLNNCYFERVYEKGSNKYQPSIGKEMMATLADLDSGSLLMGLLESNYEVSVVLRRLLRLGSGLPRDKLDQLASKLEALSQEAETKEQACEKQVLEVFPDLGKAFVSICLRALNMDAEKLINGLLCGDLPPELAALDRVTGRAPEPEQQVVNDDGGKGKEEVSDEELEKPVPICMEEMIEERGDPVPVPVPMSVPRGKAHKGKKQFEEVPEVDHQMRRFITKYAESTYDDEYDDSYMAHANLDMEAEPEAEMQHQKRAAAADATTAEEGEPIAQPVINNNNNSNNSGDKKKAGGGGGGYKKSKAASAKRKNANLKKRGMMAPPQ